ncbi:MAG: hypothetical protein COB67_07640 [SAR324 cluster bacterium]|uniref:CheW-like domain-containing protein n=1 Tax=SAR324 cluster bacterium TaxID=2024889 RepID=A0A2A4T3Y4_9DELT|nr:MAG: hypothetical protein COB67_07640 [SAR324 cluster bacterium]
MQNSNLVVSVDNNQQASSYQFVSFRVAGELFGVSILDVKEVTPMINITPVYHAPEEVLGYVNIRGEIHLVLDPRLILGLPAKKPDENSRIVIFKPTIAAPMGILVDHMEDVIEVRAHEVEQSGSIQGSSQGDNLNSQMISGICKLEKELLVVLNARNFLRKSSVS